MPQPLRAIKVIQVLSRFALDCCILIGSGGVRQCEGTLSRTTEGWCQGNCAASCCTIASSSHAAADARMYQKFRTENPVDPGNERERSADSRSMTWRTIPDAIAFSMMPGPMIQCTRTTLRLIERSVSICMPNTA
jgi:hypothetical protein